MEDESMIGETRMVLSRCGIHKCDPADCFNLHNEAKESKGSETEDELRE